jgi:hypothetical protein
MRLIALLLILSNPVFAADPDNVSLVQGEPAPYSGILMPIPRAQRVELMNIDLSTCTKRLDLSVQDNNIAQDRNTKLTAEVTRLNEEKSSGGFLSSTVGGFVLGLGSAILMAYGISRATR